MDISFGGRGGPREESFRQTHFLVAAGEEEDAETGTSKAVRFQEALRVDFFLNPFSTRSQEKAFIPTDSPHLVFLCV